ncbi:hypothetical protein [Arthrobacter sp. zg-Y179]|uniref:hypothetical protein n=1 Tax=Arthrobacter sp. zg-Y179 TaxID=2894188 RepID=UPI001E58912D|nr:hypothetical protein [Arthrobacter sp. zg-Y179]MCC9175570.1 hypothetical protein [Arthrobacter sp. zg-Y179]
MSIDVSALPVLPDTGTVRADAGKIAASGARAAALGDNLVSQWAGLQGNYLAPEQDTVYGAMQKVVPFTDETQTVASGIRSALDTFSDTVDALRPRFDAFLTSVSDHSCAPPLEDASEAAAATARLQSQMQALIREFHAAEDACAAAIGRSYLMLPDAPGMFDTPAYALGSGLISTGLQSIHHGSGQRLVRIVLDPGSNQRHLNVSGSYTIRINGRPERYFPRSSFMAPAIARLGHRALDVRMPREPVINTWSRRRPQANGRPAPIPNVPGWAKKAGNAFGVVDVGLSVYGNAAEQWNEDQLAHPEYSTAQKIGSAATNVVLESGGAAMGAAIGTGIGATLGSFIPIPVVGTVVGAAVGGWIGSSIGEGVGSAVKGIFIDGKGVGKSLKDGAKEFLDSLW